MFLSCSIDAQEICNNGIDDNGNGLVDLNDTAACSCSTSQPTLIPNASFEQKSCCPSSYSQLNCAQGWIQASDATSDYMNTCNFTFPAANAAGLIPPPDGSGLAGLISSIGYQEYIGTCLTTPMLKDTAYSIQMSIASTPITGNAGVCNGGTISYGPSDIVVYGTTDCNNLPFSGIGCPPAAQWQVLGSVSYTPINVWSLITVNFTPPVNITAIIIGSPCTLPASYNASPCYPYFYFDNLFLNKSRIIDSVLVNTITPTGSFCNGNQVLHADTIVNATYQWYLNGVAIAGQTSPVLNVSANNLPLGRYSIKTFADTSCVDASITLVANNNPPIISNAGPYCKYDSQMLLNASIAGGIWGGSGITDTVNGVFDPAVAVIGNNTVYYTLPGSGNCPRSDTAIVVVKDIPSGGAGPDTSMCSGETIFIGGQPVAGYSYSWGPSTGLSSDIDSGPSLTLTNTDTVPVIVNYSLITTDLASGCQALDQLVITVNPQPFITPVGPFCRTASPVTLTASISGGTWSGTGITNSTTGIFNPAIATVGGNLITYTVSGGCAGGDTLTINVVNPPVANAGVDKSICSGALDSIGSATITGFSYSWQPAAGLNSSTISNPYVIATNSGNSPITSNYVLTTSVFGCQSKDTVSVAINPQPVLQINNPSVACSPNNVNLTLAAVTAGSTGGGAFTYWIDSLATAPLSNPNAVAISGTYFIKATTGSSCKDIDSVIVLINSSPLANAGVDDTVCSGDSIQIGSAPIMGYTYFWFPSIGLNDNSLANPLFAMQNNGSVTTSNLYVLTVIQGACATIDSVYLNVAPPATVNAGSNQLVCANSGVVLAGTIGGSATSAVWSGGNGTFVPDSTTLNATYFPSPSEISADSVVLTLITNNPAGTCTADTASVKITITQAPTVDAGINDTVCEGNTIILNGLFGGIAISASWSGGGGSFIPNNTTANTTYTPNAGEISFGTAFLIYTTDDPSGPCSALSDTVQIHIQPSPSANAGSAQYVCVGNNVNLNGSISGSATSATWTGGNGVFLPAANVLNATYVPDTSDYVQDSIILTLTTNNPIGAPCSSSSSNVIIHFSNNPVVNFTVNNTSGCSPQCVVFTDLTDTTGSASIVDWSWNFGDNTLAVSQNPSHCYLQSGIYDITLSVVAANACSDTLIIPQLIHVNANPIAEFEPFPNPATTTTSTITLTNLSSSDAISWFWTFGDGDTLTMFTPNANHQYPYDSAGGYNISLIVQNSNGCADTVDHQIVINSEYSFYIPNSFTPNNDGINDSFGGYGMGIANYELTIFDRWGNLIFHSTDLSEQWDGKVNSAVSTVQQDVFVWKVKITDELRKKHSYIGTVTVIR